jgi:pterin-4a-carbinolamine dehydratase
LSTSPDKRAASQQPAIFISYRRSSGFVAEHVHEKLSALFGAEKVFIDRADIPPGAHFPTTISTAVKNAIVVLVVIGREWISVQDPQTFRRRLEMEDDWVRQEVEAALAGGGIIIPVLIEGATMPTKEQLPEPLQALAPLNAVQLSREHLSADFDRLIVAIRSRLGAKRVDSLLQHEGGPFPEPSKDELQPVPLSQEQLERMLKDLPQWRLVESDLDGDKRFGPGYKRVEIRRDFRFESFIDAIEFMRVAADAIDTVNHQPRRENIFRTVSVNYSTWDVGHRPSDRDLKSAQMLERLYRRFIAKS